MSGYQDREYDLSASRLKKHASCPQWYEFKYKSDKQPTKARSGYGEMGSWVHKAIENVLIQKPGERNESALLSNFKQEFFRLGDTDEIDQTLIDDRQRENALDCLPVAARFIANYSGKFNGGQPFEIDAIEKPVHVHIDNPTVDRTVYGAIDVVANNEVWDWKTGSIRETTGRDELIQGCIYMAGYHNEYGELPDAIRFIYLKEEKQREVDPTEESWQQMLKYARELVNDEATGEYEATPEDAPCYFCEYEMYCPKSEVGIGGVNEMIADGDVSMWDAI